MELDESFEATICKVGASFGFGNSECNPEKITRALGINPDDTRLKGETRRLRGGRHLEIPFSTWFITSKIDSKDVNDHLRDLLSRLKGVAGRLSPEWGTPSFSVVYKATHLWSGNGPYFEADVLRGMARFGAELWQDIYALEEETVKDSGRSLS